MSSFIKKADFDDVNFDSFQETENGISKDEAEHSFGELMTHPVKAEITTPDKVMFEGSMISIKEEEFFQEEIEGDPAPQNESATKPEMVWVIKREMIDEEETLEEERGTYPMGCKGVLITPKFKEPLLPTCEERSPTFDGNTLHPNKLEHSGKIQVIQIDQQLKPPLEENPDWNLCEEEEIPGFYLNGQCGQGKKSKDSFQVYSETDTDEQGFKCSYCYKKFGLKGTLQIHLRIHTGEKFKCSQCNKKFSQKGHLKQHLRIHTGEKPFECSQCNEKFSQKGHLKQHLRVHTGEKPYECSYCHKKCSQKESLRSHLRIHTGEKPFECSQCNKKFSERGTLRIHLRMHAGEKPFECSQCNKKFSKMEHLHSHLRIHTGERPFECSQCNKKFTQSHNLHSHLKMHTGEKPFECSQCNKKFNGKGSLRSHLKVHTVEKP